MAKSTDRFLKELPTLPLADPLRLQILTHFAHQSPFLIRDHIDQLELTSPADCDTILSACQSEVEVDPSTYPKINPQADLVALRSQYRGLGDDKWRECIDGAYHHLGKDVFAQALHRDEEQRAYYSEPGYVPSMNLAFDFIERHLNREIDSDWYLKLHKHTASHFLGEDFGETCKQEDVGHFRKSPVSMTMRSSEIRNEAVEELDALATEIEEVFGFRYASINRPWSEMEYGEGDPRQIKVLFDWFCDRFYQDIAQANTLPSNADKQEAQFRAIARLHQRLEWLHPFQDGSTRTNVVLLNKLLTDYGFHPVILDHPSSAEHYGFEEWVTYLKAGSRKWEEIQSRVHGPSSSASQ